MTAMLVAELRREVGALQARVARLERRFGVNRTPALRALPGGRA